MNKLNYLGGPGLSPKHNVYFSMYIWIVTWKGRKIIKKKPFISLVNILHMCYANKNNFNKYVISTDANEGIK